MKTPRSMSMLGAIGAAAAAGLLGLSVCLGCAAAPANTTRLQSRDFEDIAAEIAASLRASDFLLERGPADEPIVIAMSKVDNLTTDLLTEGEKWYLMDTVVDSASIRALAKERNIRFVIPAEKLRELRRQADDPTIASQRAPTHTMTASLRSITRSAGADRTDLYAATYTIVELARGENVWTGDFALKRAAVGRSYN